MPRAPGKIVIYGAGNCGRDVSRVLRDAGYEIAAFLDARARQDEKVEGISCHLPDSTEARRLADSGMAAVVAVFNFTADTGAIQNLLQETGFKNIVSYHALHAGFPGNLKSTFWLASRDFWLRHEDDISRGLEIWEDDRSRDIYLDLIELRMTGNLQLLRAPDTTHQYFPEDIPPLEEPMRLIDGGAYVGDTLAALQKFKLDEVVAFEPDPANFAKLCHFASGHSDAWRNITIFPCGLDSRTSIQRFSTGNEAGSNISETGDSVIQVVALDDVVPTFSPTYIKFDIEGFEIAALHGAEKMIKKHKPRVAICAYHLPEHLWEVPFLLKQLVPSYRLSLRYHGFNGFDVVAYGTNP